MDVDIDLTTDFDPRKIFPEWTKASILKNGMLTAHPCGMYPQAMAKDPVSGLAAIPHDKAEENGYSKIDFLHLHVYDFFNNHEEIEQLLEIEPNWKLLLAPSNQEKLFQLSKHGNLLSELKPSSVEELADCLALIRPGKTQLLETYKSNKAVARRLLYAKDDSGYSFKKSHAFGYAMVIVLQLHLITLNLL